MTFKKFIQDTKKFFGGKPVRIIVALLIIAGIMFGISLGLIALVKALSPPCKSGFHFNKTLKVCVKNGCKNICGTDTGANKKGNCLPDNYCNYSGSEGQYIYDQDSCGCKLDCSSLGEELEGFTLDGRTTIHMELQADGTYKPPSGQDNILYCGSKCEYSERKNQGFIKGTYPKGGIGWCHKGYICGKNLTVNEDAGDVKGQCWASDYFYCPDQNNDHVVCPTKDVLCNYNTEGKNARCNTVTCGKQGSSSHDRVLACAKRADCWKGPLPADVKCNRLTNKKFRTVGYCSKTNKGSTDDYCLLKDSIGEDGKGNVIRCDPPHHIGISSKLKQCSTDVYPGEVVSTKQNQQSACASCTKNLCGNGWQAAGAHPTYTCKSIDSSPEETTDPNNCAISLDECCNIPYTREEPGGGNKKGCCNNPRDALYHCLRTTQKPFDGHFLDSTLKLGTIIPCKPDDYSQSESKKKYDLNLRTFLGQSSNEETVQTICIFNSQTENTTPYAVYGQCGDKDLNHHEDNFTTIPSFTSPSGSDTEVCTWKNSSCAVGAVAPPIIGGEYHMSPYKLYKCQNSQGEQFWGGDHSNKSEKWMTAQQQKERNCPLSNYIQLFRAESSIIEGLDSITQKTPTMFEYRWDCNKLNVIAKSGKKYAWSSLAEPSYLNSIDDGDLKSLFPNYTPPGGSMSTPNIKIARRDASVKNTCQGYTSFPESVTESIKIALPTSCDYKNGDYDTNIFLAADGKYCDWKNMKYSSQNGLCQ